MELVLSNRNNRSNLNVTTSIRQTQHILHPSDRKKIQLNQVDYYSNKYFYSKTKDFVIWIKLTKKLLFQNLCH